MRVFPTLYTITVYNNITRIVTNFFENVAAYCTYNK